jgi:hypothetical protein
MSHLQRAGAMAAITQALAYIVGFAVLATVMQPEGAETWSHLERLAFVLQNKPLFQAWTLFIYVVFGMALVVLTVALQDRLGRAAPARMQVASAFGLIWAGLVIASGMISTVGLESVATLHEKDAALASATWITIGAIQNGLGGGVEVVGGAWMLLLSWAAWRAGAIPRALNAVGVLVGAAGLLTMMPPLAELGMVFGLGQILWFAGIGGVLLRTRSATGMQLAQA